MQIAHRSKLRSFVTLDKSIIREFFSHRNSALKNLSLAEAVVRPGKGTDLHIHKTAQEIYFIIEGKGRMVLEGKSASVKKYDAVLILPHKKHTITNTGKKDLRFLCICSPAYEHRDTVMVA